MTTYRKQKIGTSKITKNLSIYDLQTSKNETKSTMRKYTQLLGIGNPNKFTRRDTEPNHLKLEKHCPIPMKPDHFTHIYLRPQEAKQLHPGHPRSFFLTYTFLMAIRFDILSSPRMHWPLYIENKRASRVRLVAETRGSEKHETGHACPQGLCGLESGSRTFSLKLFSSIRNLNIVLCPNMSALQGRLEAEIRVCARRISYRRHFP